MGKSQKGASNKKAYRRSTAKLYVKGDSRVARKEKISETGAKAIALAFYPVYLVVTGTNKLLKKSSSMLNDKQRKQAGHKVDPKSYWRKVSPLFERVGSNFKDQVSPFVRKNKVALGTGLAVLAVTVAGAYALSQLPANETLVSVEEPTHVVSVQPAVVEGEPIESAQTAVASENTAMKAPEVKVMSAASVKAYQVLANGKTVANFKSENEANRLLDTLKSEFTSNKEVEVVEVYFHEAVEVVPAYLDIVTFDGYDEVSDALAYIRKGTKQEKTHKVEKGENYWVIANYYGVSPSDLEAANPEIKPEALQIGMEISLIVPKPLITVVTVENAVYSDQIAFEVEYEPTSSLYKGESKTKVNGSYGERVIQAEVLRQNGREIARKILAEDVVAEPKTKVVYQGTKDPPPRIGTGTYVHPTSRGNIVTSNFGWRYLSGREYHTGIDIGMRTGTNVKAVDGGIVTHVGYNNSEGYYVYIDHGGNISSRYLHNSKILVSRGDKVFQGQTVALSGNTGRSTGAHLHLEIRLNGVPQNPRNYINF